MIDFSPWTPFWPVFSSVHWLAAPLATGTSCRELLIWNSRATKVKRLAPVMLHFPGMGMLRSHSAALCSGVILSTLTFALSMHFRPPLLNPTVPAPFDDDLVELQIRSAPKNAEIVFLGDSITERWRFRPELFASLGSVANLGVGGSRVSNLLWLVNSGKLSVFHPKMLVVRIGANDLLPAPRFLERRRPPRVEVDRGIVLICESLHRQFPTAAVTVMPYPPPAEDLVSDGIHLNDQGYAHWAAALQH
jgi:hypothetical protein